MVLSDFNDAMLCANAENEWTTEKIMKGKRISSKNFLKFPQYENLSAYRGVFPRLSNGSKYVVFCPGLQRT